MGCLAYAAATLIAAVAIHSFCCRRSQSPDNIRHTQQYNATGLKAAAVALEPLDQSEEGAPQTPAVKIKISHDDSERSITSSESESSPTRDARGRLSKMTDKPVIATREEPPQHSVASQAAPTVAPPSTPITKPSIVQPVMPPPTLLPPRNGSPPHLKPTTTASLTPPSRGLTPPRPGGFAKATGFNNSLVPPPSAARTARQPATLGVPQQKVLNGTKMQPSSNATLAPSASTQPPSKRSSKKVILSPGHSPLDWAALTKSVAPDAPLKLRGRDASTVLGTHRLGRITPSQLKRQTGRKGKDAWTSYQGRVYNVSAYLDFHPGGVDEMMKGAGRSSDTLFAEVHPWVNWEAMLGECLVGMLVSEDDSGALGREEKEEVVENKLDEMD